MDKISKDISISRPSLYNYFSTKEEIIMALLIECSLEFVKTLSEDFIKHDKLSKEEFSEILSRRLNEHDLFLNLHSIHFLTLEKNCSQKALNKFKIEMRPFHLTIQDGLKKFFPNVTKTQEEEFIFLFFAMINGIYSLIHLTDKQRMALKVAVPDYEPPNFYDACKSGICKLIRDL